jgi:chitinase
VANLLKAAKDFGYDGIDLDWEDSLNYDNFIALAAALRASAPAGFILTAPGYPVNPNLGGVEPKIVTLVSHLDQFNMMSYYPGTAYAGYGWLSWHNSALSGWKATTPVAIDDSLARYAAAGIPKGKLGMGIAFYTVCYTGGVTAPNQSTENGVSIVGGDNVMPLSWFFGSSGPYSATYRKWDSTAQSAYLSLPSPDSHGCRYYTFDDPQSIQAKGAFAKNNGYGGTIVWTINQGTNALTQALKAGFLDP